MSGVNRLAAALLLGLGAFALYAHTAGPTLVAYRDAGEMATAVPTLGVLHPTSYPVYSLLGKLWTVLPAGDVAYRLNLFSAAAMAATWALLFWVVTPLVGAGLAASLTVSAALSYEFWWHALVSEMYALNLFLFGLVVVAAWRRQWRLTAFLFGVALANRSDLLLTLPAFVLWARARKADGEWPGWFYLAGITATGLSLYLYLPLRASAHPWMNWNDPSTVSSFFYSVLRRGYGSTLDRLSSAYQFGENFWSQWLLYLQHLIKDLPGISALAVFGSAWLWRSDRRSAFALLTGWVATGPLFIFLGNLPPNSHAVAIVEAAYLMPDAFLLLFGVAGLAWAGQSRLRGWAVAGGVLAAGLAVGTVTAPDVTKRHHWFMADFAWNVRASSAPGDVIVARSDVPLFGLYYDHWIRGSGRWPVAQGLAASPWYGEMLRRQDPMLGVQALRGHADWVRFSYGLGDRRLLATTDVEWPEDGPPSAFAAQGLLARFTRQPEPAFLPNREALSVRRGLYRYGAYRDFFSNELIEGYAKAAMRRASALSEVGSLPESQAALRRASIDFPGLPYPEQSLAMNAFRQRDYAAAERHAALAGRLFDEYRRQARDWKSLPAVVQTLREAQAQVEALRGASLERLGRDGEAEVAQKSALELDPNSADALYNLAVLYWKHSRWSDAVTYLRELAQRHPDDPRWSKYLPAAQMRAAAQQPSKS